MYQCSIENSRGKILALTGNEPNYQLYRIDGLNPVNARINTTSISTLDGARLNSARLETRNIVLYIKINGDAERNRLALYEYFPTKEQIRFYFQHGSRNVYIDGYVQTVEVTPFTNNMVMQVSLICPQPYFLSAEKYKDDMSKTNARFKFPFAIDDDKPVPISDYNPESVTSVQNVSESACGMIMLVKFNGAVKRLELANVDNGDRMILNNPSVFIAGDVVTINTNRGEKSVIMKRNGETSNIFAMLESGFTFFQLTVGENHFSFSVDPDASDKDVNVEIRHNAMYRGV